MPVEENQFFTEEQTDGVYLSLRVKQWLDKRTTPYQKLVIAETVKLGRLLALDGKVMLTEADEAFYHEMLVHPALLTVDCPKVIAVIGGGDGGTVREVLRYAVVEKVFWIEIDQEVIQSSKQWLSSTNASIFDDPRVTYAIAPGEQWLKSFNDAFDVIIVDSTDPVGISAPLFERQFFQVAQRALKHNGILALQCGTPFYFKDEVRKTFQNLKQVFNHVRLYLGFVPTYPSGLWSYALAGQWLPDLTLDELQRRQSESNLKHCHYYSPQVHLSSFALPPFVQELLV